jgi:hypothetical protein
VAFARWLGPLSFAWGAVALGVLGCSTPRAPESSSGGAGGSEPTGTVVVGVTTDLLPGDEIDRLHLTMRVAGDVLRDETLTVGPAKGALQLPTELRFDDLPDGTPVDVALEAIDGVLPFLWRTASTNVVAGRTLLLRTWLQRECIPSYRLEAGLYTPTCEAPLTCISAACKDPFVPPSDLEPYAPDWATSFVDACKPEGHGPPEITIGQGETGYQPLTDGGPMTFEKGPQGGLHVWVAVRARNLHQQGSVTTISASLPDLGTTFEDVEVGYGYDPVDDDDDGSCVLYGLRFVISNQVSTSADLVGEKLVLDVKVADVSGDIASDEKVVTLAN